MLFERGALLGALGQRLDEAVERSGSLVLVAGEAGAGKTSLVRAFVDSLDGSAQVVEGACDPLTTPRPLSPLHDFAADPDFELAIPARGDRAVIETFTELLDRLKNPVRPIVMVIEDIHWADEGTLDFVRFVGRRVMACQAVVVCTYRDDEVGPDHPLRPVLGQLTPLRSTHRMVVPPLTIDAVTSLTAGMTIEPAELFELSQLRDAIEHQEFRVLYQPILTLDGNRFAGAEALLRWQHPSRGLLAPDQFLDIAEESGLIVPIGAWVVQEACRELRRWLDAHTGLEPLGVAINLSARQLEADIVNTVRGAIRANRLDPASITIEITEGLISTGRSEAHDTIRALKDLGTWLAMDDFGTGHSSLGRLRDFEFDELKIDRRFVSDINTGDTTLVGTQVAMARGLGLNVVAEGVETAAELEYLREIGCQQVQGFLIARPLTPGAVRAVLAGPGVWTERTERRLLAVRSNA